MSTDGRGARVLHAAALQMPQHTADFDDSVRGDEALIAEEAEILKQEAGSRLRTIQSSLFTVWGNASVVDLLLRWRVQRCTTTHEVRWNKMCSCAMFSFAS